MKHKGSPFLFCFDNMLNSQPFVSDKDAIHHMLSSLKILNSDFVVCLLPKIYGYYSAAALKKKGKS